MLLVIAAGCAGGGGNHAATVVPQAAATLAPSATNGFKIPANVSRPVPPAPPNFTPKQPSTDRRASAVTPGTHPPFFNGEASLGNGAYYLAFSNGNVFGYYSYLADSNYIYHFDMGYEYVYDAKDGVGGVYFYDFTTQHWWYTGAQYPFPYIYDFSLSALLYYFPDTANAGHYTATPRYFYNFAAQQIVQVQPGPTPTPKPTATPIAFLESPVQISGTTTACTPPVPANTSCQAGGYADEYFNEVGGFQGPYTFSSSDSSVASVLGNAVNPNAYYAMGFFELAGYKPGVSTITVTSASHQATLTVYVTTLQITVALNNLPTAYSMTLTPAYDTSDNCGFSPAIPQTVRLPAPMPSSYTFTFANATTNNTVPCGLQITRYVPRLLNALSLTVSDGVNTIASANTPVSLVVGTANSVTLTPH